MKRSEKVRSDFKIYNETVRVGFELVIIELT